MGLCNLNRERCLSMSSSEPKVVGVVGVDAGDGRTGGKPARDMLYFDDLKTLRIRAGLSISKLAASAEVGRNLVGDLENHKKATAEKVWRIFHALNRRYKELGVEELDPNVQLSVVSEYGNANKAD